jgi:phosphatidylinositol phospholipase C delta
MNDKRGSLTIEGALPHEELEHLRQGAKLFKFERAGRQPKRTYFRVIVDKDTQALVVASSTGHAMESIPLWVIDRVQAGQHTPAFGGFNGLFKRETGLSFSIIFGDKDCWTSTIDLIAPTLQLFNLWLFGLQKLVDASKFDRERRCKSNPEEFFFKEKFETATNRKKKNAMNFAQVCRMLDGMNVQESQIRSAFEQTDSGGKGKITLQQFRTVLLPQLHTRPEIEQLFCSILQCRAVHAKMQMPLSRLLEFVREEQKEDIDEVMLQQIVLRLQPDSGGAWLGCEAFTKFLSRPTNAAIAPTFWTVEHDMHRPLTDYFMNSSHNTYLEGDQLTSKSSVNRYIEDLLAGVRSIELDVWDGADGLPIILHGGTMTSKIACDDVLCAIAEYAFKTTPYPVTLSIENHLNKQQQMTMVDQMRRAFGERIYISSAAERAGHLNGSIPRLPSPTELKYRIIIKARVGRAHHHEGHVDSLRVNAQGNPTRAVSFGHGHMAPEQGGGAQAKGTKKRRATGKVSLMSDIKEHTIVNSGYVNSEYDTEEEEDELDSEDEDEVHAHARTHSRMHSRTHSRMHTPLSCAYLVLCTTLYPQLSHTLTNHHHQLKPKTNTNKQTTH